MMRMRRNDIGWFLLLLLLHFFVPLILLRLFLPLKYSRDSIAPPFLFLGTFAIVSFCNRSLGI